METQQVLTSQPKQLMADDRKRALNEWVRERLRQEIANGPRGHLTVVAKKIGVSVPYLSNLTLLNGATRNPGDKLLRGVAKYWGMSVEQMANLAAAGASSTHLQMRSLEREDERPHSYNPAVMRAILSHRDRLTKDALAQFYADHHDITAVHVVCDYLSRPAGSAKVSIELVSRDYVRICRAAATIAGTGQRNSDLPDSYVAAIGERDSRSIGG